MLLPSSLESVERSAEGLVIIVMELAGRFPFSSRPVGTNKISYLLVTSSSSWSISPGGLASCDLSFASRMGSFVVAIVLFLPGRKVSCAVS